jgi:hypothetical protein
MPASAHLNDERHEARARQAPRVLDSQLGIMGQRRSIPGDVSAVGHKGPTLAQGCHHRNIIGCRAALRTWVLNNVQTGAGSHAGVALLKRDKTAGHREETIHFLYQWVVPVPRAGTNSAFTAVHMCTATAGVSAAAPALEAKPAAPGYTQRKAKALAHLDAHSVIRHPQRDFSGAAKQRRR